MFWGRVLFPSTTELQKMPTRHFLFLVARSPEGKKAPKRIFGPHTLGDRLSGYLWFGLYPFMRLPTASCCDNPRLPSALQVALPKWPELFRAPHVGKVGRSVIGLFKYIPDTLTWPFYFCDRACGGRHLPRHSSLQERCRPGISPSSSVGGNTQRPRDRPFS